jgi:DNA-binding transcriptional ArsR family regulator
MTSNLPVAASRQALTRPEVLATFFQALADPTRVRILELLAERPMTMTESRVDAGIGPGSRVVAPELSPLVRLRPGRGRRSVQSLHAHR